MHVDDEVPAAEDFMRGAGGSSLKFVVLRIAGREDHLAAGIIDIDKLPVLKMLRAICLANNNLKNILICPERLHTFHDHLHLITIPPLGQAVVTRNLVAGNIEDDVGTHEKLL
ncbi:hypothetical protein [Falsirhodobacter halotolerans]|uniref:hypothetical protein n=1 Tax=Falsirhodobacter halotolerans TaxID=1146892 RepID=UPI001FD22D05|nr:hypothetical protein [Falsirhodobacter halotolerans]MCJ8139384.1 hypothetical protein [Falsirhodobacter halotolerans]